MKFIVGCLKGIEDIVINEVKEKFNANAKKVANGRVVFDSERLKELKSIYFVSELVKEFKFKELKDIINEINNFDFSVFDKEINICCTREGKHNFSSQDIRNKTGKILHDTNYKVNYKSENVFYIDIVDDFCFLGKLIKKDLCKREYRIKRNNKSIDACLAYSLFKIVDLKKGDSIIDPFCKDCVILIEGFLEGYKNLYGFDDNKNNLRNASINIKMAKAKIKILEDWDSLKKVNNIIAAIPIESKRNVNYLRNIFEKFVDSVNVRNYLIIVGFRTNLFEEIAKKRLKKVKEKEVFVGELKYKILVYKP